MTAFDPKRTFPAARKSLAQIGYEPVLSDRLICYSAGMNSPKINVLSDRAIALYQAGRLGEALANFERVLKLAPNLGAAHANRGLVLRDMTRLDEALVSVDKAISLQPDYADAWNIRSAVLRDMKRFDEALASVDKVVALNSGSSQAWSNRAALLHDMKQLDEALASSNKATSLQPNHANAWHNRGVVLRDLKRLVEALASFDKAISLQPNYVDAWNNRGLVLKDRKQLDEALANFDKAIALKSDFPDAWVNRGNVLSELGRPEEALVSFDRAITLVPDNAIFWTNRANVLSELKRPEEAVASYGKAFAINPDAEFLLGRYLSQKMVVCDWDRLDDNIGKCGAAIRAAKKIILPFPLLSLVDDPALQKMAARVFSDALWPRNRALGPITRRDANEKIRIGYYSAEFHRHATFHLMAELLEAHSAARFELYGFSFGPNQLDEMRQRVSAAFDKFVDVRSMSDRDVARLSRECGIDIAVDLKGYTQGSRPGIFAEGCAPIQVQYLGYPGTMGADYIDYLVADRTVIPPGSQNDYMEKIVWLPHSYQANDSKRKISGRVFTRQEAGLPISGFVFCCFNNNYKILPETFESWMRILKAVDGSVLWLLESNLASAENLRKDAAARGVDAGRLIFAGRLPVDEHLARQRLADLFLDTWPCNAHTTASDALWAGLPVLTCMGKSFASRVAASLLNAVGLPDLITSSREDYETLAIALASHPASLAGFRKTLEHNRTAAPLFNGKLTARHLEAGYEAIYARYQSGLPPDNIEISSYLDNVEVFAR
jgi:protein O-GlcNAc transferase